MSIGPLTMQPFFQSFVRTFGSSVERAGIPYRSLSALPAAITKDGLIAYDTTGEAKFRPLILPFDENNGARSMYDDAALKLGGLIQERYGGVKPSSISGSHFLTMARRIDEVMGMRASDILGAIKDHPEALDLNAEEMSDMVARFKFLGRHTIREFVGLRREELDNPARVRINSNVLLAAADDMRSLAEHGYHRNFLTADEAAAYFYISGVFYFSVGTADSAQAASCAFLSSTWQFFNANNFVAAAISAETAAYLDDPDDILHLVQKDAFEAAAENWLDSARQMIDDPIGMLASLYRGILASCMRSNNILDEVKKELHTKASAIASDLGMHAAAGKEFLQLANVLMSSDKSELLGMIAYFLSMARASFNRADGFGGLVTALDQLSSDARDEAEMLQVEFNEAAKAEEGDLRIWGKGIVKLRHGNFSDALHDLELVHKMIGDHPMLLGDIGLAYHLLAHQLIERGSREEAYGLLDEAAEYLDRAIEAAEINEMEMPILHARRGALYATRGDYSRALKKLHIALEMDGENRETSEYIKAVEALNERPRRSKGSNGLRVVDPA